MDIDEDQIEKRAPQKQYKTEAAAKAAATRAANAAKAQAKAEAAPVQRANRSTTEEAEAVSAGRSEARSPTGRAVVTGRDGESLTRVQTFVGDHFEIPQKLIPKGWSYQWIPVTVAGNAEVVADTNHVMHQQGWRPVPAERYAGVLVPKGAKGAFIRGQQMLVERPAQLTEEARAEDIYNARKLISDRNESLKLAGVKTAMPDGFEMGGR